MQTAVGLAKLVGVTNIKVLEWNTDPFCKTQKQEGNLEGNLLPNPLRDLGSIVQNI